MAMPPKEGMTLDPVAAREVAIAYETALQIAGEAASAFATMPAFELRRRLAGLILAAASHGPIKAERLTDAALRGLAVHRPYADLSL